jgi:sodium-coupled neutral amino acid transporter 11
MHAFYELDYEKAVAHNCCSTFRIKFQRFQGCKWRTYSSCYYNVLYLSDGNVCVSHIWRKKMKTSSVKWQLTLCLSEILSARHVIVQLYLKGDMDGPNSNRWCNRRIIVTLCLYICTLIPALIVDDLGPVLALTGNLGASCLSFIATGLVYLGINGDEFLSDLANRLRQKGYGSGNATGSVKNGAGEVELPVVGDASARLPSNSATAPTDLSPLQGSKPWWWWIGGYPLWVAIASSGAHGTRTFLSDLHGGQPPPPDEAGSIGPRQRDYNISIFFIVFGTLAAVVGVASTIYVQIHDIFYSPH